MYNNNIYKISQRLLIIESISFNLYHMYTQQIVGIYSLNRYNYNFCD